MRSCLEVNIGCSDIPKSLFIKSANTKRLIRLTERHSTTQIDIVWKRLNFGSLPFVYELALFHVLQYILAVVVANRSGIRTTPPNKIMCLYECAGRESWAAIQSKCECLRTWDKVLYSSYIYSHSW